MNKPSQHTQRVQAVNWGRAINALLALALALAALAPISAPAAAAKDDEPRAHPALLQLAAEHPDDVFKVIIQREVKNKHLQEDEPEAEVAKEGGKVKKQLQMIESFSAELTGKQIVKLARKRKVRWITFDAPLVSTALPGFGGTGQVTTAIGNANDNANAMVLQPDGKIVVAGSSSNGTYSDFALVRYNSNGNLDTGFDTDGKLTTVVSSQDDTALAVATQPDGKIVAAGHAKVGSYMDMAVVRYNANGSLDTTFSGDGMATIAIGTRDDRALAVLIQPDGKILLVGYYYVTSANDDFVLVRLNADGSLDTTFDGDGKATTAFGAYRDRAYAAKLQPDGKIVVAGSANNSSQVSDFALARYNTNGSLDTTFDGDGKATTNINGLGDIAYGVALQSDGKIVVGGSVETVTNIYDLAAARYNANGSLDTAFGNNGRVITAFGIDTDYGRTILVQPNGKIVVAGEGRNELSAYAFGAVRLLSNGSFDTSFDTDGKATALVGSTNNIGYAAVVQPDGKIVVAGMGSNGTNNDFALVRFNVDGGLDCSQCLDAGNLANVYNRAIGADRLWNAPGYLQGQGITVAVVDSGIASHGDLQSRILAHNNQTSDPDANDNYVHGTFVAGVIGGNGAASNGTRMGVAPGVNLINVKISNNQGVGTTSDLIDGLQWINDNRVAYNIKVVNISLNSTVAESYHSNPINAAVEILWFNGITVVVAAGNNGTGAGPVTLYPPANDPFVITVGAAEDKGTAALSDDTLAAFSAYGTTADGFAKPDLVAPGRNLISLLASTNAHGYVNHPAHRVDASYFRMSGTSMSAPVVSGAVALLLQDEPGLTPDQVKYRLKATANTAWPGQDAAKAGAGYLDAYAAVNGTTTESANTGLTVSNLLTTGTNPVNSSVNWNSVNWNSVSWSSVSWSSVNWNSVSWSSVSWSSAVWDD